MNTETKNIRIVGLGGMGILKSSGILAEALFRHGYDVKKAEIHGMSQRGGSVASDIRFGREILSPMIPDGEVDFLMVVAPEEEPNHTYSLRPEGKVISAASMDETIVPNRKTVNIALLGALSPYLDLPVDLWHTTITEAFPVKFHDANLRAFDSARAWAQKRS